MWKMPAVFLAAAFFSIALPLVWHVGESGPVRRLRERKDVLGALGLLVWGVVFTALIVGVLIALFAILWVAGMLPEE